jgi:hypothetical protein
MTLKRLWLFSHNTNLSNLLLLPKKMKLLGTSSAKTIKGETLSYLTGILYLSPSTLSGVGNVCPWAGTCKEACLNTSGRGAFSNVQKARIAKTRFFFSDRDAFMETLFEDCKALIAKAKRLGMTPCVRLNGTSDLAFHRLTVPSQDKTLMQCFPDVPFYDYTKSVKKALDNAKGLHAPNYTVVFSRDSAANEAECQQVLSAGGNVAVVFRASLPSVFWHRPVINGDVTDLRFLDRRARAGRSGYVVGLKAKGKAKRDVSGFVVDAAN